MYQNQTDGHTHLVFDDFEQKSSTFYFTDQACNLILGDNFLLNQYFSYLEMYQNQTYGHSHLVFDDSQQKSSTFYFTDDTSLMATHT